jgi:hypothetical protein
MALLKNGEILLADRGFCSFHAFWKMSQVGVDALMRLNGVRNEAAPKIRPVSG